MDTPENEWQVNGRSDEWSTNTHCGPNDATPCDALRDVMCGNVAFTVSFGRRYTGSQQCDYSHSVSFSGSFVSEIVAGDVRVMRIRILVIVTGGAPCVSRAQSGNVSGAKDLLSED